MAKTTFGAAEITFKVAVITSSVTKITFVVAEITLKLVVITSPVVKITFIVSEITFKGTNKKILKTKTVKLKS